MGEAVGALQHASVTALELVLKDLAHAYSVALTWPHLDQPDTQRTLTLDVFISTIFPVRPHDQGLCWQVQQLDMLLICLYPTCGLHVTCHLRGPPGTLLKSITQACLAHLWLQAVLFVWGWSACCGGSWGMAHTHAAQQCPHGLV